MSVYVLGQHFDIHDFRWMSKQTQLTVIKSKRLEYALYVTFETVLYATKGRPASPMYHSAMAQLIQTTRG